MNERQLLVEPAPALAQLAPYTTGRPEHGIDLVLDFNESLAPPAAVAREPGVAGWCVNRYPDYDELERALARRLGVDRRRILATGGADDALERAVRVSCWPGRQAILTTPSYGMIRRFAVVAGAGVVQVPWWRGDYPLDEVLATTDDSTGLVAVVSPNNPTGAVIEPTTLHRLAEALPQTLVLLDQAYVDFTTPKNDLIEVASAHPNVVMVRTLSKAWGGAGLRVGYAVADPRVVDWLRRIGLPFPVASPSVAVAVAVLQDEGPSPQRIERIIAERAELTALLGSLGAEAIPSEGSFVLARFDNANLVWRSLVASGIAVRAFPGRSELDGWLRFTLPGENGPFRRLTEALTTTLAPEAILFDLDGVLADVSGSYRRAILETAASFGVELTEKDISRAKTEANANNDWRVTQRLLQDNGVSLPLEDVTARFEALYQGTPDRPGLRCSETLLVTAGLLKQLAKRIPLGLVTGRPRPDAERFLEDHFIRGLFSAVVAMEDAPAKPDPGPIRRALEELGVDHAWMVGDTPDDIRAALAAGVLPLGVPAPGDNLAAAAEALTNAGAVLILDETASILEVLP